MKKANVICLLAIAVAVGWASVETFRLWDVTQQAADSQQLQLRASAKLEAARAKQTQVAHSDATPTSSTTQK